MDGHRSGRACWSALGAMSLVGAVACGGDDAGTTAPGNPGAVVGTTDQGLRIRLEPLDGRRVRVDVEADCFDEDGDSRPVARRDQINPQLADDHELVAPVMEDGSFEIDDSYLVDSTDGVTGDVTIHIKGSFVDDGTATGTLDAHQVWHDPTHDELFDECSTDTIGWRADEPRASTTGDQHQPSRTYPAALDGVGTLLPNGP